MRIINEQVQAMADQIGAAIQIDTKAGTATVTEGLYDKTLPDGLTPEVVKAVSDHNTTFVAAGTLAFGKASVEAMKGSKKLETLELDIPMGHKDNLGLHTSRNVTVTAPGSDTKIEKFGVVKATYEVRAGKNGGQLKAARQTVADLAVAALK